LRSNQDTCGPDYFRLFFTGTDDRVAHYHPEPVPNFTWAPPTCQRRVNCPGVLSCSHCSGPASVKIVTRNPAPAVATIPSDPPFKRPRLSHSDQQTRPPGIGWVWCNSHAAWGRHADADCSRRVTTPSDLKVRTIKLAQGSDHLFLPKVPSRNPTPRTPYQAPGNTWTPPGTPALSEISDDETPQIRMAAIPSDVPFYDPELGADTMEMLIHFHCAIKIANFHMITPRSKHFNTKFHYLREQVQNNFITLQHVPGATNVADIWTKPLNKLKFIRFRSRLGIGLPGS
jgi:hypothetical protein